MSLLNIRVRFKHSRTGKHVVLPAIANDDGIFMPLLRYFEDINKQCSGSKLEKIRHAFGLFYAYTAAAAPVGFGTRKLSGREHARHFRRFRDALIQGTVDEATAEDESGLRWERGSVSKANRVVADLTNFFEWEDGEDEGDAQRLNPQIASRWHEDVAARAAYEFRRSRAFLGHTWERPGAIRVRSRFTGPVRGVRRASQAVKRFPDGCFERLLFQGFTTRSLSNLRDILIAILLNKGGLRISEVMHIWITDVTKDPISGMAHIVITHPSEGACPGRWGTDFKTRAQCLEEVFNRSARNSLASSDAEHAGWKSGLDKLEVLWCEPLWGEYFQRLWKVYTERVQNVIPTSLRSHPYAFIVLRGNTVGRPLTLDAYRDSHQKAVFRAGLVPVDSDGTLKQLGLTEHGHRHAYGHRAKNLADLSPDLVRQMMHHASPESQKVYTQRTWHEQMEVLVKASENLHCRSEAVERLL